MATHNNNKQNFVSALLDERNQTKEFIEANSIYMKFMKRKKK